MSILEGPISKELVPRHSSHNACPHCKTCMYYIVARLGHKTMGGGGLTLCLPPRYILRHSSFDRYIYDLDKRSYDFVECSFDVDTKFGEASYFIWIDVPPELHVETLFETLIFEIKS